MNGNFTSIGIGHYKNAAGVDYWTQLLSINLYKKNDFKM